MLTRAAKRLKLEKDRLENAESAGSFARLPLPLVASIVSFLSVKEHVGSAAVLGKALLVACKSSLSWPSHIDFIRLREFPCADWVRSWNCQPQSVRLPNEVDMRFYPDIDAERMWQSVATLCARAACLHIENVGKREPDAGLCDLARFNDNSFPQLKVLKFRDDAYEAYVRTFLTIVGERALVHGQLTELDLICNNTEPFEWDPAKLPQLQRLRLRTRTPGVHSSVLPILSEATLRPYHGMMEGEAWPHLLEQLRQAPLRPRVTIQADGVSLPRVVHTTVRSGLPVAGIVSEEHSGPLAPASCLSIRTVERLVLNGPAAGVLLGLHSLPLLRQVSLQHTCLRDDECHALLSLADAGCQVYLLSCTADAADKLAFEQRMRARHPCSYDTVFGKGVRFVIGSN